MRPGAACFLILLAGSVAGCAVIDDDSMRIPCRNPNPIDADCSYDFSGVAAIARFNETYELGRIRAAVDAEQFQVTISKENAVVAQRGALRLTVEAREGWFWFALQVDAENVSGLTEDEAKAEGERLCATGIKDEMEQAVASFESRTGWSREMWEPCGANIGVA